MQQLFHSKNTEDLRTVCDYLCRLSETHPIITFSGSLGAGKTTLIRQLCGLLGVQEPVFSPSYSIVNEYRGTRGAVFHFDCYRIKDEMEMYDIGYEDYFYSNQLCLVEWPEMIPSLLPPDAVSVHIAVKEDNTREIAVMTAK